MRSGLGATRINGLEDAITEVAIRVERGMEQALMVDGYPPFTEPNTPYEQYQKLLAMRAVNDPDFVNNRKAQDELAFLSLRFGQPPPLQTPTGTVPGAPGAMAAQLSYLQGGAP